MKRHFLTHPIKSFRNVPDDGLPTIWYSYSSLTTVIYFCRPSMLRDTYGDPMERNGYWSMPLSFKQFKGWNFNMFCNDMNLQKLLFRYIIIIDGGSTTYDEKDRWSVVTSEDSYDLRLPDHCYVSPLRLSGISIYSWNIVWTTATTSKLASVRGEEEDVVKLSLRILRCIRWL